MGLIVDFNIDSTLFVIDESGLDIRLSGFHDVSIAYEDSHSSDMYLACKFGIGTPKPMRLFVREKT